MYENGRDSRNEEALRGSSLALRSPGRDVERGNNNT
jgi:hypothetical protein